MKISRDFSIPLPKFHSRCSDRLQKDLLRGFHKVILNSHQYAASFQVIPSYSAPCFQGHRQIHHHPSRYKGSHPVQNSDHLHCGCRMVEECLIVVVRFRGQLHPDSLHQLKILRSECFHQKQCSSDKNSHYGYSQDGKPGLVNLVRFAHRLLYYEYPGML